MVLITLQRLFGQVAKLLVEYKNMHNMFVVVAVVANDDRWGITRNNTCASTFKKIINEQ